MNEAFVLDASMTGAWHFTDEETLATAAVEQLTIESTVVVPRHWFAEVANLLWTGERDKRAAPSDTARFIERLGLLILKVEEFEGEDMFQRVLPLARAHRLSVYDAVYLELAERRGLPLATLDKPLRRAAASVGLALLPVQP